MRTLTLGLAAAFVTSTGSAEAATDPREIIEATVVDVIAILADEQATIDAKRDSLEEIAYARFDFRTMSRLVLARNWKRLSKEQQQEFVDEFTLYLAHDYGGRLQRYEQEQVDVVGERAEPRGDVTIRTQIVGGENDGALVDYRMRNRKDEWRIIDVVIEGISLVANFRDQFREVMGNEGPEKLLEKLREKNAAAESKPAA
jgi:phospholipid transport system substrate-binding protein